MSKKNRVISLLTAILVVVAGFVLAAPPAFAATYTPPSLRQRVDLNAGWRFLKGDPAGAEATTFNDSTWPQLNLPHTWNAADGADGGNNYYRGIGWYRRPR